jgi:iron complex transport system ATP-binding protein
MESLMLSAEHVNVSIAGTILVREATLRIAAGRIVALMGPNGAGKSTLLRALAGDLVPDSGTITIDGAPLATMPPTERALRRAVVSQRSSLAFGFSVLETALLGRYPHGGGEQAADVRIARQALALCDVDALESRDASTLSGGELARVMMARALAQIDGGTGARYLLLDEATSALDPAHQHRLLGRLRDIVRTRQVGILIVLHDLNLAARYADEVALIREGHVVAHGEPDAVLTSAWIAATFDVEAVLVANPAGSRPVILING